jgi:sensor histidine kinase YesM
MTFPGKYGSFRFALLSLVSALFIIYPNIACLPFELSFLDKPGQQAHLCFFAFRYTFFFLLIWFLLRYNLRNMKDCPFRKRIIRSFIIVAVAYALYVAFSLICYKRSDCFGSILLFQFLVLCLLCTFAGHVFFLYDIQLKKEQEIEQLKVENLQSRYDALANQINPHFFFNSLNGLTALIRKKNDGDTLAYVNKLSDVFRYILQSDKRGLVTLDEELEFVQAFRYMMEVRFAHKLVFRIEVDEARRNLQLPALSLLPLIDNVVVHNTIDSHHFMEVSIYLNEETELVVSSPIYPKQDPPATNGTGLKNLENRFLLLMNKQIRMENDGKVFRVYLPLK